MSFCYLSFSGIHGVVLGGKERKGKGRCGEEWRFGFVGFELVLSIVRPL